MFIYLPTFLSVCFTPCIIISCIMIAFITSTTEFRVFLVPTHVSFPSLHATACCTAQTSSNAHNNYCCGLRGRRRRQMWLLLIWCFDIVKYQRTRAARPIPNSNCGDARFFSLAFLALTIITVICSSTVVG